jgi:hypothetical protein
MSHFTRLETKLVDRAHLLAALTDLGYTYEEGDVEIGGYNGRRTKVDVKVPTSNPAYDVGFVREGDRYELVADWLMLRNVVDRNQLLAAVTRRYAYHATIENLQREGFGLVSEEQEVDGRVHLVLRRMA